MKVYLNNKFIDEEKATINIKDRGLLLGDSIFDTLLYNKNKIILFDFHFARSVSYTHLTLPTNREV